MAYVDYSYYTGTYKGTSVPSTIFDNLAIQASYFIDYITFNRIKSLETVPDEVKMAVCSVIDAQYKLDNDGGVKVSESIGRHSVTYASANANVTEDNKKYNAARVYLAHTGLLYRGVK
jgi:hypothetical protein